MRGWVAAAVLVLLSACARHPESPLFTGEPYLLVWAGDADRQNSDFLAVLDADPTSPSYGKVLRTYPVRSRGNEPQALLGAPRADPRALVGVRWLPPASRPAPPPPERAGGGGPPASAPRTTTSRSPTDTCSAPAPM